VEVNTTEVVVSRWMESAPDWPYAEMRFAVLPTRYGEAELRLRELLRGFLPDRVLLLGVAPTEATARLERFALNVDDSDSEDAAGDLRRGTPILAGGPAAFATGLDLQRLFDELIEAGVRAEISNHAGAYVCNHAYYTALSHALAAGAGCQVLFMHVPRLPAEGGDGARQALVHEVARAAGIVAGAMAKHITGIET
jgi:pyroglutamyl-peptidase